MNPTQPLRNKKPYEKPAMRIVAIADGTQTLGIGCKLSSGGPTGKGVTPCYPGNYCARPGS